MIKYLTINEYVQQSGKLSGNHWNSDTVERRWDYHRKARDVVRAMGLNSPKQVLEMGTMGMTLVNGSDTMDFFEGNLEEWKFDGMNPTYIHDARSMPWPIGDKQYDLFIALRVFQHLHPFQKECFQEAMRIAKNIILVVPEEYGNKGINYSSLVKWNRGVYPNINMVTEFGDLYFWNLEKPLKNDPRPLLLRHKQLIKNWWSFLGQIPLVRLVKNKVLGERVISVLDRKNS